MLVSDSVLIAARATLERLHVTTAQSERLVETVSGTGSTAKSWTAQGAIACRVETSMGGVSDGRITGGDQSSRMVYTYTVFAAHDADILTGDRLTLPSGIVLTVEQSSRGQSQAFVSAFECSEATP